CNKVAVSEWIIAMILNLSRNLPKYIRNTNLPKGKFPDSEKGLKDKKITILGKGNIGSRVGKICESLEMNVSFFRRGDNLIDSVKDADVIVNVLSSNPTTQGLLDKKFFSSLKKGSYFITVTGSSICDIDVMIDALDKDILAGVAHDSGGIQIGDVQDPFYKKLLAHPKILVTPHVSFNTDVTNRTGNDMMIDNVEAWLKGKPINLVE
ncbi:NAD(P)-dependent oxidoreductase, partial [Candidatus Aenigmatarchaeota archaeon]